MLIRAVCKEDMSAIVSLHRSAYVDTREHLTALLPAHLLRQYYSELVRSNPYSYIAFDDSGTPIGFVVGGLKTQLSVHNFILNHRVELALILLLHPRIMIVKIRHILRSRGWASTVPARLLSIAVESREQHKGAGRMLLLHFEQRLREHGILQYGLSVKVNNHQAIRFYENNSFQIERETSNGKYYVKRLIN